MCGIAGVIGVRGGGRTNEAELTALRDAQTHRGPDDAGLWLSEDSTVGLGHREIPIRVDEIRERMPDAVRALDQPSVDGINTYFVSEAAVRAGLKVAVSGVGGDEVFGGYGTFERVPRIQRLRRMIPIGASLAAAAVDRLPGGRFTSRASNGLRFGTDLPGAYFAERCLFTPAEARRLLAPELADAVVDPAAELRDRVGVDALPKDEHISALELRQYMLAQLLRDTDAVSMRHSLEVRTPLVDRELLERACLIPAPLRHAGPAKRRLREAPDPPVPEALWNRRKQGFTLPFDHWLKTGGIELQLPEHPWLRADAMDNLVSGFRAGRVHFSRVWILHVLAHYLN
ncbi:MAG: asparagine synthetase B family protein [Myxococcota bacterium]|jgi:asparagine synthase (glutamine-hydrolysing)|nr:hypothetical protein [Deltaproteobacteria bacterium]MCP4243327.1 asparagine synthase [bacterium]MDP6073690.1 asparagine synthetase B family protein [Myxococcota bacterium]MDP6244329.1 asparagine synthetase B family protein [Myxococcota bacterium]MDP7076383.1 asparagine synthetase B family protein [Myxococcota bacterium]